MRIWGQWAENGGDLWGMSFAFVSHMDIKRQKISGVVAKEPWKNYQ